MAHSSTAALAVLALAMSFAQPATAADEAVSAEDAFQAGRALLKDKRYADACPKFEASQRKDPASGTLLALAYCQELSGLIASALHNYSGAADLAAQEGHAERQKAATERVRALGERVSTLTIIVPEALSRLPGFRVTRDGVEIERTAYGTALPMNGGAHMIEASAPGRSTWVGAITLKSEREKKTLTLPILEPTQTPALTVITPKNQARPAVPPADAGYVADQGNHRPFGVLEQASLALAVGGLASFGVGSAFGLMAKSKNDASNANGHCDSRGCDERGTELRNDALSAATASTWSFIIGGGLLAGGITLYVLSAPKSKASARIDANLGSAPRITLTGNF
jgi:hypothetical protein